MSPHLFPSSAVRLSLAWLVTVLAPPSLGVCANCEQPFRRGDVDAEGTINITDGLRVLDFLFLGGPAPPCKDAADTDDDGKILVTDAVFLLDFLFRGGRPLPPPVGDCGPDPTPDSLDCSAFAPCPAGGQEVDTSRDLENCGGCGVRCSDLGGPHVALLGCEGGWCFVRRCEEGFADADGIVENGCEARALERTSPAWLLQSGSSDYASVAALPDGSVWLATMVDWFDRVESTELACSRELGNTNRGLILSRYDGDGRLRWTTFAGGNGGGHVSDVAVLPDGSALITGAFQFEVVFGGGDPNETTLVSHGDSDQFLARYGADGRLAWVRADGAAFSDWGSSVAAPPDGSSYVGGVFLGETVLGKGEASEVRFQSVNSPPQMGESAWKTDAYLAHYSVEGSLLWASHLAGTHSDYIHEVKALQDGSAAIAGSFWETMLLGDGNDAVTLISPERSDTFLARYLSGGSLAWAEQIHTKGQGYPFDLEERDDGNLLLLGGITANEPVAMFDLGGPRETTLVGMDTFLAAYDRDGSFLWARGIASGYALGILPDGSTLVAGVADAPITFGRGTPNETRLEPLGPLNLFTARFDDRGDFSWARLAPTDGYQVPRDMAILEDGSVFLAGRFSYEMTLFAGEPNERTLVPGGTFLARIAGPRIGAGNLPPCSPVNPGGACPEGQPCVNGGCKPRCPEDEFLCGLISAHSNLPGVRIEFPEQPCRFSLSEVASGIELVYNVVVEQDVPGVKSVPSSAEQCGAPRPPSGLSVVWEVIRGGDQQYCICDAGLCFGREPAERDLRRGVFEVAFPWDGRNWHGPSDTGNSPGPPFPPGQYIFEAYAAGTFRTATEPWSFEIVSRFGIELVPD